jgi:hypothetical protein
MAPRRSNCKDSEDVLQIMHEATECPHTLPSGFGLQANRSKGQLISIMDSSIGTRSSSSIGNRDIAPVAQVLPDASRHAGAVISKIEDVFEHMIDDLGSDNRELVIPLKSRSRASGETLDAADGAIKQPPATEARAIRFPGKTVQEAWKFSRSILGL